MKKILIIALSILSQSSYAQNKQLHKQSMAVRNFINPYKYYADKPDTAAQLAIVYATDNLLDPPNGAVQIKYVELNTKGVMLQGSQGVFNCTGACYKAWNNAAANNTAFLIIVDSVVHHSIIPQ